MKRKKPASPYLLITYNIFKLAYQIGSLPFKAFYSLSNLIKQAISLLLATFKWIFEQIIRFINILIVYIYRLRYVFLLIIATYLGYLSFNYYQSIPNPKQKHDFLSSGKIIITDRNQLPFFNSQNVSQQLIEKKFSTHLNDNQLADKLTDRVKINNPDLLKKQIITLRIKNNFSSAELQKLYLELSNYVVFNYQDLPIYKRSPAVVNLVLDNLIHQYGQDNLSNKNLVIKTTIDQTLQNSLQQIAVENNQLDNMVILFQIDTKEIVAVINQKDPLKNKSLKKVISQNNLNLTDNHKNYLNQGREVITK